MQIAKASKWDIMNGSAASSRVSREKAGSSAGAASAACKGVEDLELLKTIGTGTFARVYLCR